MTTLDATVEVVRRRARASGVTPSTRWEELDVDSLALAAIVVELEDVLGVELDDDRVRWAGVATVGDLARLFER